MDFLNNPYVITLIVAVFGLLVRFHPAAAKWPNYLIPYLNVVLAFLIKLSAPTDAEAQGLDTLAVMATQAANSSFWSKLVASVMQALLNGLLFDKFLKAPVKRMVE